MKNKLVIKTVFGGILGLAIFLTTYSFVGWFMSQPKEIVEPFLLYGTASLAVVMFSYMTYLASK